MTSNNKAPDHILYVAASQLPRLQREALRAVGVEVTYLDSETLAETMRDEALRTETCHRLAAATHCVLASSVGPQATAIVIQTRLKAQTETWVTNRDAAAFARGLELLQDSPAVQRHRLIEPTKLFATLLALGAEAPRMVGVTGPAIRPPLPAPYVADPSAYTTLSREDATFRAYERFREGRFDARAIVEATHPDVRGVYARQALHHLICHTPTEDLHLLSTARVQRLWAEERNAGAFRSVLHPLFAHAMARDGGRMTLAALPPELLGLRAEFEAAWPAVVARAHDAFALECVSAAALDNEDRSALDDAALVWPIVPSEDPLAHDTDPALFRPTLLTFVVAGRYRSAPEVLYEAYRRWGGRPYQENIVRDQLRTYVERSQPTSPAETEAWVRLLTTTPHGRFRRCVTLAISDLWPRIEIPIANAFAHQVPHQRIPCFTAEGLLREDLFAEVTNPHLRDDLDYFGSRDLQKGHVRARPGAGA